MPRAAFIMNATGALARADRSRSLRRPKAPGLVDTRGPSRPTPRSAAVRGEEAFTAASGSRGYGSGAGPSTPGEPYAEAPRLAGVAPREMDTRESVVAIPIGAA